MQLESLTSNSAPYGVVQSMVVTDSTVDVGAMVAFDEVGLQTIALHLPHPYWTGTFPEGVWSKDLRTCKTTIFLTGL